MQIILKKPTSPCSLYQKNTEDQKQGKSSLINSIKESKIRLIKSCFKLNASTSPLSIFIQNSAFSKQEECRTITQVETMLFGLNSTYPKIKKIFKMRQNRKIFKMIPNKNKFKRRFSKNQLQRCKPSQYDCSFFCFMELNWSHLHLSAPNLQQLLLNDMQPYKFIQTMFSFFNSFGASSNFQKHRLILTTKNYDSPDQNSLKKIIDTFRGQDQQTRSQIGFATVIKKIHTSKSSKDWIYLLKNLLILDRVVEENCFLQEISTLNLQPIENYKQQSEIAKALNSQNILKNYWQLIKSKSLLLSQASLSKSNHEAQIINSSGSKLKKQLTHSKNSNIGGRPKAASETKTDKNLPFDFRRSILSILRSQKQQFLKALNLNQIYKQSLQLECSFDYIFKMIKSIQNDQSKCGKKKSSALKEEVLYNSKLELKNSGKKNFGNGFGSQKGKDEKQQLYENLLSNSFNFSNEDASLKQTERHKLEREEFFNSKLVSYLRLQLLYKLLSVYSNQLICVWTFLLRLIQQTGLNNSNQSMLTLKIQSSKDKQIISEADVINWKKIIVKLLAYSERIITYVERHKNIKGFELINYQELRPFQDIDIIALLDDYIEHKKCLDLPDIVKIEELGAITNVANIIKVQKKAQHSNEKALTARKMLCTSQNQKDKSNPFQNWHNSYSPNFPPKQILTVDLLIQLRQNQSNLVADSPNQDQDDQSFYQPFVASRHSCIYNLMQPRITAISELQFIPVEEMKKQIESKKNEQPLQSVVNCRKRNFYYFKPAGSENSFQNIYSSAPYTAWMS